MSEAKGRHSMAAVYERISTAGREHLEQAITARNRPLRARWGVSAVIRPNGVVAERLERAAKFAAHHAGYQHHVYDRSNLHTTLYSLEGYGDAPDDTERLVRAYLDQLRRANPVCPSLHFVGLAASPGGVIAQGWPSDQGRLNRLREELHSGLARRGKLAEADYFAGVRESAHASLVVFQGGIDDSRGLLRHLREQATADYGKCAPSFIEIAKYRLSDAQVVLDIVAKVPISSAAS